MPRIIELVLVSAVLAAAWSDFRSRQIPNWITVPSAILGLAFHFWFSGLNGAITSIEGMALGLGIFIAFYFAGGMGAGDVKLFGAVGSLVGPQSLVMIFVFTGVI